MNLASKWAFKKGYLDLSYQSVNNWGASNEYPRYLKPFLLAYAKAKKYDELMKES